jgi:hypothetical protein
MHRHGRKVVSKVDATNVATQLLGTQFRQPQILLRAPLSIASQTIQLPMQIKSSVTQCIQILLRGKGGKRFYVGVPFVVSDVCIKKDVHR